MQSKNFKIIDCFCGAGGLSYGFECAGFDVLLGIDNDEMALKTFQSNHKNVQIICKDIINISYKDDILPLLNESNIDVVIGGPPCQGFSLSGLRKFNDPRNEFKLFETC